jgi:hypothetical protein
MTVIFSKGPKNKTDTTYLFHLNEQLIVFSTSGTSFEQKSLSGSNLVILKGFGDFNARIKTLWKPTQDILRLESNES